MKFLFHFLISFLIFSCGGEVKNEPQHVVPIVPASSNAQLLISSDSILFPRAKDFFAGTLRADVKTSFVTGIADTLESIKKLHAWLKSDEFMHKETDAKHNTAPRTKEENHSVYLKDVYVFGVKREDDNDFHLILASSKKIGKDQLFFSGEISGLPDSTSAYYSKLFEVRKTLIAYFGVDADAEFVFVADEQNPPIHLDYIGGSLFFDNHHYGAHSSVKGYEVCSAWEIHPITALAFHSKH